MTPPVHGHADEGSQLTSRASRGISRALKRRGSAALDFPGSPLGRTGRCGEPVFRRGNRARFDCLRARPDSETKGEADLSTQQARAQAPSRLSRPHGDGRRPQGARTRAAPAAARSSPPDRGGRWLWPPPDRSPGHEDAAEWSLNALHEDGRPDAAGEPLGRLTKRAEFQRVSRGRRVSVETFTLQSRRREETEPEAAASARVGLTVTKSVGDAVERNRIRRRLKEALRAAAPLEAEGDHDYVLMARREALGRRFAALVDDVRDAFRAARRGGGPARARGRPTGRRRTETGEHELRGHAKPLSRDRAVGPGDGRAGNISTPGRLYQREHQAQTQANRSGSDERGQPAPSPARRARRPLRRPARRAAGGAPKTRRARRSPRARASPSTRRASAARSTSRAARSTTSCSRTIARPSTRRARTSGSSRRAARRTPIGPRPASSARGGVKTPNLDTVWTADRQDADRRAAGDADLGQRRRASSSSASSRSTTNTCSRSPTRSPTPARAPATLQPLCAHPAPRQARTSPAIRCCTRASSASSATAVEVARKITYAGIDKETGKVRALQGRRRLARLHRQILGLGDHSRADRADRRALLGERNRAAGGLPGRLPRAGDRRSRPALRSRRRPASSPAPRKSARSTITRPSLGIKKFDLMIDWGWFYFITKPAVPPDRRDLHSSSAISASRSSSSPCWSSSPSSRSPTAPTSRWRR